MIRAALLLLLSTPALAELPDLRAPMKFGASHPKDLGLIISFAHYPHIGLDVPFADRDGDAAQVLLESRGLPRHRIQRFDSALVSVLRQAAIQMADMRADTWWIFVSGHGATLPDGRQVIIGDRADNSMEALKLESFPVDELQAIAARSKAKRVMIFLDVCTGGRGRDDRVVYDARTAGPAKPLAPQAKVAVWRAAPPGDVAVPYWRAQYGTFTFSVLTGLRGAADGVSGRPRDGKVDGDELHTHLVNTYRALNLWKSEPPPPIARAHDWKAVVFAEGRLAGPLTLPSKVADPDEDQKYRALWAAQREAEAKVKARAREAEVKARTFEATRQDQVATQAREWETVKASGLRGEEVAPKMLRHFLERWSKAEIANPYKVEAERLLALNEGFVQIRPGKFMMGSPQSEPGRVDDEVQHEVNIKRGFWLKRTEVTQGEWRAVMNSTPSYFSECGEDCPVERVSWFEALDYLNTRSAAEGLPQCYRMSECTGTLGGGCEGGSTEGVWCDGDYKCEVSAVEPGCLGYRLPSEAEWEYAARAGTTTATYAGPMRIVGEYNASVLGGVAVYGGNSGVSYSGGIVCGNWKERAVEASKCGPRTVGSMRPNRWGLHDMLGNVWEWTQDGYGPYSAAPRDGGAAEAPVGRVVRVVRGGGYVSFARVVRAADRGGNAASERLSDVGFRPARSLP